MRNNFIRRVKAGGEDGGFFVIGLDASVIKHLGIQKHCEIDIRFWNEERGQVEDAFLDLHSVGKEPAVRQVADILVTFKEAGLVVSKLTAVSRDNPAVMGSGLSARILWI